LKYLDIPPLQSAQGTLVLPGSKSISNRVLLLAALAQGTTSIQGLLIAEDTEVMCQALKTLGCFIQNDQNAVEIKGTEGHFIQTKAKLFLANAGTAMRPLLATLAILGGEYQLTGIPRMYERPIKNLVDSLRTIGCHITYLGKKGYPPLQIHQPTLHIKNPIKIQANVSSQFLSALLIALPLTKHTKDILVQIEGAIISKPYVDLTLQLLKHFHVNIEEQDHQVYKIPAGSKFVSPGRIQVEPDASSASYFIALGAIASTQGITIQGLGTESIQGDIHFTEVVKAMGAKVTTQPRQIQVYRKRWPLRGITIDCNHIPDAAMTLAMMALYADSPTTLHNIASWRVKETDRIAAMACELRKLGAMVKEGYDYLKITPPKAIDWKPASIHTYNDHRMAMCFALAAFNPARVPIRIENPGCVSKTFPTYFNTLFKVTQAQSIPVITIDGPSASGKGTIAKRLAESLGFHYLDSGILYRLVALLAQRHHLSTALPDREKLIHILQKTKIQIHANKIYLAEESVEDDIRTENMSTLASKLAAFSDIRKKLLSIQRHFLQLPGLVCDGRDMGTTVFPDAQLKIYLTASPQVRSQRRYQQLISRGENAIIENLLNHLKERDQRDKKRDINPLQPAKEAQVLDNSNLSIDETLNILLSLWSKTLGL
jgi:3-phosphoshikimate 1-carboxyvinyltransferase